MHPSPPTAPFLLGDWRVDPSSGQLTRGTAQVQLDDRARRLLMCLSGRAGDDVSIDELLEAAWAGVIVSPDSVYQAITTLRRALGDSTRQPAYIATVPRQGYRLVAPVRPEATEATEGQATPAAEAPATAAPTEAQATAAAGATSTAAAGATSTPAADAASAMPAAFATPATPAKPAPPARRRPSWPLAALGVLLITAGAWWAVGAPGLRSPTGARSADAAAAATAAARSVAVMPFLDFTDKMDEEPFADGLTEQLIDRLGQLGGVRVASRTSTFFYKDKQVPVADIARALGVAYVVEGSVRKSGGTLRVTARLVRASDGTQAWSQTVDRPASDALAIQDDVAAAVLGALQSAWSAAPGSPPSPQGGPAGGSIVPSR